MKTILILLLAVAGLQVKSQFATWYFGLNAGLRFENGSVEALLDGSLNTDEGCAVQLDGLGNVLFYTDGRTVWDMTHAIMLNGTALFGDETTTQSAIVVPRTGSATQYFIFTVAPEGQPGGLRYSVVDMSENGGFGVVTPMKNILVVTPVCEKVVAVEHANGFDQWIVTRLHQENIYHSYLLSASGLSLQPVISAVGFQLSNEPDGTPGYLKVSPDGSRLASATKSPPVVELFDFDNGTGLLSTPVLLTGFLRPPYGVEFAPNSELLYVSEPNLQALPSTVESHLHQFDITLASAEEINGSRTIVRSWLGTSGALQLGPDDRIYCAQNVDTSIGIVNEPNMTGLACDMVPSAISLGGRLCRWGLPMSFDGVGHGTVEDPEIGMSNVFTPNGDGVNDLFRPLGSTASGPASLSVFNRWGTEIFHSNGVIVWDGRSNAGEVAPSGTYFYSVVPGAMAGSTLTRAGHFTLLR